MSLWGGRFQGKLDPDAWKLNASIDFDQRMALQDVRGSLAWAKAIHQAGLLSLEELNNIQQGLNAIRDEFKGDSFVIAPGDEDIHSAIERRLGELIGPTAGKLHTGRSRNDQVATDLRLWLLDHIPDMNAKIRDLQTALIQRAEKDMDVLMPGYTHLQKAQPILLSHWWLSHFWPLQRDRQRLEDLAIRTAVLPLGSGALAGTPFPIDRYTLAKELGFLQPSTNSIDAVSDRDFAAEFLFVATLVSTHLSRFAEAMILFSSAEFGFFELSDAFSTGSSLMPQKKNPDIFELTRGKAGTIQGYLTGLLTTLKGLPSAYDKDLQEDKVPVFTVFDLLMSLFSVLPNAILTLRVQPDRLLASIDPSMMATDLADYLVRKGLPFREAHTIIGQVVQRSLSLKVNLDELPLDELRNLTPLFDSDVSAVFDPSDSIARRSVVGGTSPQAVSQQLKEARESLESALRH